jgi:hypothetical protein
MDLYIDYPDNIACWQRLAKEYIYITVVTSEH